MATFGRSDDLRGAQFVGVDLRGARIIGSELAGDARQYHNRQVGNRGVDQAWHANLENICE